jgi:hypothetical protein
VWIERAGHEPTDPLNTWYTGYRLYLAEQPPPYTGDLYDARIRLLPNPADPTLWEAYFSWNPTTPALSCCDFLAASFQQAASTLDPRLAIALPGDMIRFNGRGPSYVIDQIQQDKLIFRATPAQSAALMKYAHPAPNSPSQLLAYQPGVRFEIMRRPIKSSDTPLELPRNTAIDLSLSGYGPPYATPYNLIPAYNPFVYDPTLYAARFREVLPEYDIVIMFKPEGGVDRVYYVAHELDVLSYWELPQGMISLLVARDDQIGRDSLRNLNIVNVHDTNVIGPLGESNLRDQDNIWLSISTITGRIQSSPNGDAFVDPMTGAPLPQVKLPLNPSDDARTFLQNARRFATTGQSLGGQ